MRYQDNAIVAKRKSLPAFCFIVFFFFNHTATTEIYTLSLHDALPIFALDEPLMPTVYLSAMQVPSNTNIIVVRSTRPDADVIATVREEVARLDRDMPVYAARPMPDIVAASPGVPVRRVLTAAFTGFAALAVVLGALGLF